MSKPACWKCGSDKVAVTFIGYTPGRLTCAACCNTWIDGDIAEFQLEA